MTVRSDIETNDQINQCVNLLKRILDNNLLGIYLFGSLAIGKQEPFSDIDIFAVVKCPLTEAEKVELVTNLLSISGIYQKSSKRPVEMTIVIKSDVNPWHYPPTFDFQYGEWLRKEFEDENIHPWPAKEMPDLAILITQLLLVNKKLYGGDANQLLAQVPYQDFIRATKDILPGILNDLENDTVNVLLTLARIWCSLETNEIQSKIEAADWAMLVLPEDYHGVMQSTKALYMGDKKEDWSELKNLIMPCAHFMLAKIRDRITFLEFSDNKNYVKIAKIEGEK